MVTELTPLRHDKTAPVSDVNKETKESIVEGIQIVQIADVTSYQFDGMEINLSNLSAFDAESMKQNVAALIFRMRTEGVPVADPVSSLKGENPPTYAREEGGDRVWYPLIRSISGPTPILNKNAVIAGLIGQSGYADDSIGSTITDGVLTYTFYDEKGKPIVNPTSSEIYE